MDRDHFIISVYCLVCHHFREIVADCPLRRRGFAPALSDEEGRAVLQFCRAAQLSAQEGREVRPEEII